MSKEKPSQSAAQTENETKKLEDLVKKTLVEVQKSQEAQQHKIEKMLADNKVQSVAEQKTHVDTKEELALQKIKEKEQEAEAEQSRELPHQLNQASSKTDPDAAFRDHPKIKADDAAHNYNVERYQKYEELKSKEKEETRLEEEQKVKKNTDAQTRELKEATEKAQKMKVASEKAAIRAKKAEKEL